MKLEFWEVLVICLAVAMGVAWISFKMLVKHYLPSYLTEKGKNLATKEDVAAITKLVEEAKLQSTMVVEQFKATHQLRLAALDKRLEKHQEAFTHWMELYRVLADVQRGRIAEVALECQRWWDASCIYLEPDVRTAFHEAVLHAQYFQEHRVTHPEVVADILIAIEAAGDKILAAVQLPPMTEAEKKNLKES
ncbi:hypothetical protein [Variovorax sp. dw_954]|uniref:hypothetical protein n=1 Tax=Variovorax sp. dw_954 TaxID=2720078 RepID=UPI001BD32BB4|nr:hypothetical protein [Variovorax sp. dw_954]